MAEPPPHVLRVPRWTLAIHAVQILFAIIILGLDAYGIRWIAYNALIYSLVTCICTLGVCIYLIVSQLFLYNFYNMYIALIGHIWMIIFWVTDLGLVANLARLWANPEYYYVYYYYVWFKKRDLESLHKRDTTTTGAYYGALTAGAIFAAIQLVSWVFSVVMLLMHINKHRSEAANQTQPSQPPPQYAPPGQQPVAMEKYGQTTIQPVPQATPQQQYAQPVQPPQGPQFIQPPQQAYAAPNPQDPIPRQDTVSPISQAGYAPVNPNVSELGAQHTGGYSQVAELSTPQHTGAAPYPPNASELSTPQHTGAPATDLPELSNQK